MYNKYRSVFLLRDHLLFYKQVLHVYYYPNKHMEKLSNHAINVDGRVF
jgi:hypothetical protein